MNRKIEDLLTFIYGEDEKNRTVPQLESLIARRLERITPRMDHGRGFLPLDETDSFVITYGDQFRKEGRSHLEALGDFCRDNLAGFISGVHILPFFPYTSDDGFSIVDYRKVNPDWGDWRDIEEISSGFRMMSDLVLNHCSAESEWFKAYLKNDGEYGGYFIDVPENTDTSMIFRPRALPLLTSFDTEGGRKFVWTTFSSDQVDLNFSNPQVLLEMIDVFLYHVQRGIQVIRLDAIAYLWKELGHPSIHHPKTHAVVKLFRAIVDLYVPWVVIITETNVPHEDNISYFGDGTDEAQMVYQFALPPLTLDAFLRGDAGHLRRWASGLPKPDGRVTYFNFLASHDGIGVLPAQGILSPEEVLELVESVKERGGLVSYKATAAGDVPYELNINYLSAVAESSLPADLRAAKFLASQSIILGFPGVPGIYIHSLLGSESWPEGVGQTGMNRTINRQKLDYTEVLKQLGDSGSLRSLVFSGYRKMLKARSGHAAFHPASDFRVMDTRGGLLAFERIPENGERILCLVNVSCEKTTAAVPEAEMYDIITDRRVHAVHRDGKNCLDLGPYEVLWLR